MENYNSNDFSNEFNKNNNIIKFYKPSPENTMINNDNLSYEEKMRQLQAERMQIQSRIENLRNESNNFEKKRNGLTPTGKKVLYYNKYPCEYLNNLLEKCFINGYINSPNDEIIKQKMREDFSNLTNDLLDDFEVFKNRQKMFFKNLEKKKVEAANETIKKAKEKNIKRNFNFRKRFRIF